MDPKVHFLVHNVLLLVLIRDQMFPIHVHQSLSSILLLSSHLCLDLLTALFLQDYLPKRMQGSFTRAACPAYLTLHDLVRLITFVEMLPLMHFAIFLLLLPAAVRAFSSTSSSHIPSVYMTDFGGHYPSSCRL